MNRTNCPLRSAKNGTVSTLIIVLACLSLIAVHEAIHIIVMKAFSPEKIKCRMRFPTVSAGCKHLFHIRQFIIVTIAPVVVLGCALIVLFLTLPSKYDLLLSVLIVLNFAEASGDYRQIYLTAKFPNGSLFEDDSEVTRMLTQTKSQMIEVASSFSLEDCHVTDDFK